MKNCIAIGNNAQAYGKNCIVLGDECKSFIDSQVVVGEWLFDEPIPDAVQEMIRTNPQEVAWLLQVIVRMAVRGPVTFT